MIAAELCTVLAATVDELLVVALLADVVFDEREGELVVDGDEDTDRSALEVGVIADCDEQPAMVTIATADTARPTPRTLRTVSPHLVRVTNHGICL